MRTTKPVLTAAAAIAAVGIIAGAVLSTSTTHADPAHTIVTTIETPAQPTVLHFTRGATPPAAATGSTTPSDAPSITTAHLPATTGTGHAEAFGWRCGLTLTGYGVAALAGIILFYLGSPIAIPLIMWLTRLPEYKALSIYNACK